jgi:hypothetical protein
MKICPPFLHSERSSAYHVHAIMLCTIEISWHSGRWNILLLVWKHGVHVTAQLILVDRLTFNTLEYMGGLGACSRSLSWYAHTAPDCMNLM